MSPESAKDFYDKQYELHKDRRIVCPNSLHDIEKAHRRVGGVIRAFRISNRLRGAEVLDVGCGLGYYTKALSSAGANVTGIDISKVGIELAKSTFPECQFRCAAWPDDVEKGAQFDLVWVVGLSLINTFDIRVINEKFIIEALQRLKPNGCIVLGWGSNFSGRTLGNWSHWPISMLRRMRPVCGLSAPIVPEASAPIFPETCAPWLSWAMIRASYLLRKSIPIFMFRRKNEEGACQSPRNRS